MVDARWINVRLLSPDTLEGGMTLSESEFLRTRLEALEQVKTEHDLMEWDSETQSWPEYLLLPEKGIGRLEEAYKAKLGWIYGIGGG